MHAFLVFCVIAEAAFIGLGIWYSRKLCVGLDATSERLDALIAELEKKADETIVRCVFSDYGRELAALNKKHADLVNQCGIMNDQSVVELTELRSVIHQQSEDIGRRIADTEAKLSDIAEGCERMDSDLSTTSEDVRECLEFRQSDIEGFNARIAEITDAQEKARRKSGLRNSPAAFESIRAVAESSSSRQKPDKFHDDIVAAATG